MPAQLGMANPTDAQSKNLANLFATSQLRFLAAERAFGQSKKPKSWVAAFDNLFCDSDFSSLCLRADIRSSGCHATVLAAVRSFRKRGGLSQSFLCRLFRA